MTAALEQRRAVSSAAPAPAPRKARSAARRRGLTTSAAVRGHAHRAGSARAGYAALESDLSQAIGDDQSAFKTAVGSGSAALSPVEPVVIIAALLMALGCWWGLRRRLAEYR
jgi:hypothetical protein